MNTNMLASDMLMIGILKFTHCDKKQHLRKQS